MRLEELINNKSFMFNIPFRVYHYIQPLSDEEGYMILMYDSEKDLTIDPKLCFETITAINLSDDNIIEIETC